MQSVHSACRQKRHYFGEPNTCPQHLGASKCSPTASSGTHAGCSGAAMVTGLYRQRTAQSDIEARNAAAARCRSQSQSRNKKTKKAKLSTKTASSMLRWRQTHQRNQRTQEVLPAAQTCRHIFVLMFRQRACGIKQGGSATQRVLHPHATDASDGD